MRIDQRLHPVVTGVTSGVVGLLIAAGTYGGAAPSGGVVTPTIPSTSRPAPSTPALTPAALPLIEAVLGPPEVIEVPDVAVSSAADPEGPAPTNTAQPAEAADARRTPTGPLEGGGPTDPPPASPSRPGPGIVFGFPTRLLPRPTQSTTTTTTSSTTTTTTAPTTTTTTTEPTTTTTTTEPTTTTTA